MDACLASSLAFPISRICPPCKSQHGFFASAASESMGLRLRESSGVKSRAPSNSRVNGSRVFTVAGPLPLLDGFLGKEKKSSSLPQQVGTEESPKSTQPQKQVNGKANNSTSPSQAVGPTDSAAVETAAAVAAPTASSEAAVAEAEKQEASQKPKIQVYWHTEQGLREEMEDEVAVEHDFYNGFVYAAVFDGHVGRSTVEFLKEELHEECLEHLNGGKHLESEDLSIATAALEKAFAKTDERLLEWLEQHKEEPDSGSTATAVFVRQDRLFVAHLGDSRAVMAQAGDSEDLSVDHRPHGGSEMAEAEKERIKQAGGWVSGGRVCGMIAVSRAFGNKVLKTGREEWLQQGIKKGKWTLGFVKKLRLDKAWLSAHPDVYASELGEDVEFVLVASDGLWDAVRSSEAVRFVRRKLEEHGDPKKACQELVSFAIKERKSDDNVSALLIMLK